MCFNVTQLQMRTLCFVFPRDSVTLCVIHFYCMRSPFVPAAWEMFSSPISQDYNIINESEVLHKETANRGISRSCSWNGNNIPK